MTKSQVMNEVIDVRSFVNKNARPGPPLRSASSEPNRGQESHDVHGRVTDLA